MPIAEMSLVEQNMNVVKRDGRMEEVAFEKVQERIVKAATGLTVNATKVAQGVLTRIVDGITTTELDNITANLAYSWSTLHPDYATLASRIAISNHQKNTPKRMLEVVEILNTVKDKTGRPASLLDPAFVELVRDNAERIESHIQYDRDFNLDFFGFRTLERAYLLRDTERRVIERPQHLWMRVALGLWLNDLPKAFETYDMMSQKYYTHATPTLFNSGTKRPQLSSCFLLAMKDDSIRGIYDTLQDCALISQYGGGIGLHISNIRAQGALIRGTGGVSNGVVPMLRVFNNTARYVDQCFAPETGVWTEKGVKAISNVVAGDRVLTSGAEETVDVDGKHAVNVRAPKYNTVTKCVTHNYTGPVLQVTVQSQHSTKTITVTEKHPVLAKRKSRSEEYDYHELGELRKGDLIAYPNTDMTGFVGCEIQEIQESTYSGILYDLEVEGTHDYLVDGLGIAHNGGGKRNGSFAMYLEPWHADVEHFLEMKKNTGSEEERARDLFYAMWMPDLFMERVDANGEWTLFCPSEAPGLADVVGADFKALYERYEAEGRGRKTIKAQKLWFQILDSQIETGTPYLLYKDAANLKSNQQNLGVIKSSNLCVAPETLIYTKQGLLPIQAIAGRDVELWNGEAWSTSRVVKTGEMQKLIKVSLSNGAVIECTPYHKFIITEHYYDRRTIKTALRIEAKDLKQGMKLHKWENAVVEGSKEQDFKYAYTHGFFCGDGTYSNGKPTCSLYGEKKELVPYLDIKSMTGIPDASNRLNTTLHADLEKKYKVPINASLECRLRWLEGLMDSDGCVCRNGTNESLQVGSIHESFLNDVRIMLVGLGVNSKVTKAFEQRKTMMPDGKGGQKLYDCVEVWRLLISSTGLHTLSNLGFSPHRLLIIAQKPQRCAEQYVQVVSVTDEGRVDDTYCFNEPRNNAGMFNGVLTGNCCEIVEYSSPTETAVCNLASLSLPAFVKDGVFDFTQLKAVTKVVIRNLNRVIDINYYPIPEAERSNKRHRPIGLGVQGLADVFAMLGMPWESDEAVVLNKRIFAHMYYASLESSCDLAAKEGKYETYVGSPAFHGKLQFDLWNVKPLADEGLDWDSLANDISRIGLRNSLLIAPMPTASTSQILGNCECIEPYATHIFTRRTLAGEFIVLNKHLVKALLDRGLWTTQVKDAIIGNNGSVTGLPMIPEDIQRIFKTVWEIKQKTLIDMAADRGPYVCQSQSLNLFLGDPDYRKLTSMHFYAWRKGLKTGIYYLRTKAVASAQKFTVEPTAKLAEKPEEKPAVNQVEECVMCSS